MHNKMHFQIGNPLLEFNTDFNSRAEFLWSHGLISDSTYYLFTSVCNNSQVRREYQRGALSPVCTRVISQVSSEIGKFIDSYDITLDVCLSTVLSQSQVLDKMVSFFLNFYVLMFLFSFSTF